MDTDTASGELARCRARSSRTSGTWCRDLNRARSLFLRKIRLIFWIRIGTDLQGICYAYFLPAVFNRLISVFFHIFVPKVNVYFLFKDRKYRYRIFFQKEGKTRRIQILFLMENFGFRNRICNKVNPERHGEN